MAVNIVSANLIMFVLFSIPRLRLIICTRIVKQELINSIWKECRKILVEVQAKDIINTRTN